MFTSQKWMIALLVAILAAPAFAQGEPPTPVNNDLLEKIARLEERINVLETEKTENDSTAFEAQINALSENLRLPLAPNDARGSFNNGVLTFQSEDKNFKLHVGGRIQLDFAYGTQNGDAEGSLGSGVDTDDDGVDDAFNRYTFGDGAIGRRVRLRFDAQIYENIKFQLEVDFAGGDADFNDVWIQFSNIEVVGNIRVGHQKVPQGLEFAASSNDVVFIERSAGHNLFTGVRDSGVVLFRNFLEGDRIFATVGAYHNVDSFGDSDPPTDGAYTFAARLAGTPIYEDEGRLVLHLGASIVYRNPGDDIERYRSFVGTAIADPFFDTGEFATDNIIKYAVEIAFVCDAFAAQAEYFFVDNMGDDVSSEDPTFYSIYAQVSYFLTGESRNYVRKSAKFGGIKPNENALVGDGGIGAWEIGARASYADVNDDVNGGEVFSLTFGVNWWLNPRTVVRLNYIYADINDHAADPLSGIPVAQGEGIIHIVALRFQVTF